MSYNETLQYLYNLTKYGIKLGLKNTTELLKLLGNPERTFRAVHIAGTNGKGSTARMIAAVLEEMGFRTGLFTSPHLVSFTERITINGREIEESEVVRLTGEIRERIGDTLKPTFFEFITAMAFRYFWENSVEWAVVETGMGGRFDATNVLIPEATVITDISMDHSEFLGDSLEKIAFEKAGIIKEGVPVVTSSQAEEALSVIQKRAEKLKSPLYIYERDFFSEYQKSENSLSFDFHAFQPFRFTLKGVELSTEAPHQIRNASLAIETVLTIFDPDRAEIKNPIIRALKRTTFPGRCEIRSIRGRELMFDGAHNPDASERLKAVLGRLLKSGRYSSVVTVLGVMADKDIKALLRPLVNVTSKLILTAPSYNRAASVELLEAQLKEVMEGNGMKRLEVFKEDSIKRALNRAFSIAGRDELIVVTGSFYTVGEALETLGAKAVLSDLREIR